MKDPYVYDNTNVLINLATLIYYFLKKDKIILGIIEVCSTNREQQVWYKFIKPFYLY